MNLPQSNDRYEVCFEGIPSFPQEGWLLDYYAPILGLKTVAIYLALRNEPRGVWGTLGSFFLRYQVTEGEFASALSGLEAIGLIKTWQKQNADVNDYVYAIYCPRNPKSFFGSELLCGTLRRYVSPQQFDALLQKYQLDPLPQEGFTDVSTKFFEHFQDGDATHYVAVKNLMGESALTLRVLFDYDRFFAALKQEEPLIQEKMFSREETDFIRDLAALYAYDEENMASLVVRVLETDKPFGAKLNKDRLRSLCALYEERPYFHREKEEKRETSHLSGRSGIAEVVRAMEEKSCSEFLSDLQGGGKPAPKEVQIANSLTQDMGLTSGQANAVIFYLLKVRERPTLTPTMATNLAAAVLRNDAKTALDAFDYLIQTSPENAKKEQTKSRAKPSVVPPAQPALPPKKTVETEEEDGDEDYAAFLEKL
ncbi:MAG: hypothetical protein PUC66_07360 [Erysipelotrichaceae bacterium]|nr:hypothetical protein [Erysipelotrichaceae bacterium]